MSHFIGSKNFRESTLQKPTKPYKNPTKTYRETYKTLQKSRVVNFSSRVLQGFENPTKPYKTLQKSRVFCRCRVAFVDPRNRQLLEDNDALNNQIKMGKEMLKRLREEKSELQNALENAKNHEPDVEGKYKQYF